ncbi:DUF4391 domain-containing protein [Latilactobacillus sakei]|uniref:DUF4391 domain-containing protein n=2 Tax=Latilactobacillus sakei TaxID=1599 RepID=UPI0025B39A4E|nr:DUF4391 domain-containing protein [Latilactobacillus sakei]MDN4009378.1 DUF4391 domain-containing protein [Latilactobacillus sakei]
METKEIIKFWQFPSATVINRNLPKTQIFPHIKNPKDKQFLTDAVQSIYMLANFKYENTNIPKYESDDELYQEIWFYYLKMKDSGNAARVYRLLSGLIPYPIIALIDEPDDFVVYTGRLKKAANNFLKLVNVYPSPEYQKDNLQQVLESLSLADLSKQNLKTLYDDLRQLLTTQLAQQQYDQQIEVISINQKDELDQLNQMIETVKIKIRKEKQLNRKIDMQMQLHGLKQQLQSILAEKEGLL